MADWYYMFNGQQNGPVTGSQLKSLAATGGLGPEDLVWNESMADWVAAQRVRGLTFARSAPAAAPRQVISAPAPTYAPQPAEAPAEEAYAPLPEPAPAEYETVPQQASQPVNYARQSDEAVSGPTINYLRQTRPWVLLISIILFIVVGLMAVGAVFGLIAAVAGGAIATRAASSAGSSGGAPAMAGGAVVGIGIVLVVVMLIYAALLFFPALFLMKYASAIKRLMSSRQSKDLEAAMRAQKSYWMFMGILTLIGISLYAIGFLLTLTGAAFH